MSAGAPHAAASGMRQVWPFAALSAVYCAHGALMNPFLPLWLQSLGLSLVAISALTSIQAVTRMVAPYAWGALSDRTGERLRLMRWGAGLAWLASVGLWWSGGMWWWGLVLGVLYLQTSGMMPMTEAALAHAASHSGGFDTKLYGRVRLCGSLGFMVAVVAAGAWYEHVGMASFPLIVSLSLAGLVAVLVWMPEARDAPAHAQAVAAPMGPVLAQPEVRWFFASVFFHILSHMGIYSFFALYLNALGYSKTMIGVLWAVSVVVEIGWFFTQSRWIPRLRLSAWLVLCGAVMALRMAVTASLASVLWLLVLMQALHALTFAAHHSASIALVSRYFPDRLRGRGQALYTVIGYGVPGVGGGLAGGQLSSHFGLASVFWATAAMAVCATLCALKVWRLSQRPATRSP